MVIGLKLGATLRHLWSERRRQQAALLALPALLALLFAGHTYRLRRQMAAQEQALGLLARSQAMLSVDTPDRETVAEARLLAVTAVQLDRANTGGENGHLLLPWTYQLARHPTQAGPPPPSLTVQSGAVWDVTWSESGHRLAAGGDDGRVIIWETTGWQSVATLIGHRSWVNDVAFKGDDRRLASASDDGRVIVWDTSTWQQVATLSGHTGEIYSVAWNAAGDRLAASSWDGTILIWETATWRQVATVVERPPAPLSIRALAWRPDGRRLAAGSDRGQVTLWETATWREVMTLTGATGAVFSIAWSGDGRELVAGLSDGGLVVWQGGGRRPSTILKAHDGIVSEVAWSPDGRRLASAGRDGRIVIWDTAVWQPLTTVGDHVDQVLSEAWRGDGRYLASGDAAGRVIITDVTDPADRNCQLAGRNFTWPEWQRHFPGQPYRSVCPQWPVDSSVPVPKS